jgi:hypothetical protein
MNIRKQPPPQSLTPRRLSIGIGIISLLLVGLALYWLWPTPQLGADEEVFRTVDALFTAVTGRNDKALTQCEKRLRVYREAGKLPAPAADMLESVITQARGGRWEPAATRLYAFILAQRADGPRESTKRKPSKA